MDTSKSNKLSELGKSKSNGRKGPDAKTNGANRRRYRTGERAKCMNPTCNETFRVNAENHRYHSTGCRIKHQRLIKQQEQSQ